MIPFTTVTLVVGKPFQAVFIMRALMVSGVIEISFWIIRAAAAATTGVAMLVPLMLRYLSPGGVVQIPRALHIGSGVTASAGYVVARKLPGDSSETMRLPGAIRSGFTTWSLAVGPLEL